jgi:hypothetical protein
MTKTSCEGEQSLVERVEEESECDQSFRFPTI